ncbi:hypothetical protein, partial [Pararcticibacter amylolyticus]
VPPLVVELDAEQPDIAQACPDRPLLYGRQEAPGERGGGGLQNCISPSPPELAFTLQANFPYHSDILFPLLTYGKPKR